MLFGVEEGDDHGHRAHEDAGHITGHEQGGDGNAARDAGVDDEGAGRGDQQAGGGGIDVDGGGEGGVIALFLLHGVQGAADGRRSRHGRAGQRAEEHVAQHVGVGQGAGDAADDELGEVVEPPLFMMLPARMKRGMASRLKLSTPLFIFCMMMKMTWSQGRFIRVVAREETTIPTEMGTPRKSRTKKIPNRTRTESKIFIQRPPYLISMPVKSSTRLMICATMVKTPAMGAMA